MILERFINSGHWICIIVVFTIAGTSNAEIATFDDLVLSPESYWNGSDESGGFTSGGIYFNNNYDPVWFSWDGFAYSNITDTTTSGFAAQYNAITGAGQGGSPNYAVCFVGWSSLPTMILNTPGIVDGLYVTNSNYAYYSMLYGDAFAKKFGGETGGDRDWFMLTIKGRDANGVTTGTADFYLADYSFENSIDDYIVDTWQYVDLSSLGIVKSIEFALSSSDTGDMGMNTPASIAIDTIVCRPTNTQAGPYTEEGISGYIDPNDGRRDAEPDEPNAIVNPIFRGWAAEVVDYHQTAGVDPQWSDPNKALGPVTGNSYDIFSLGELSREQINQGESQGWITVTFDESVRNVKGYDFAVFENGLISSQYDPGKGIISGELFAELAYVEVSSNGEDFTRFPSVSLTEQSGNMWSTTEISKVYNLAGKHPNANGICTGTPFDLSEITNNSDVISGLVDINDIRYVRIVDIPGSGDFYDEALMHIDPDTWPAWDFYSNNHPIFDAWQTYGSGGFDLEAIGILEEQEYSADINLDGIVDQSDLDMLESAWNTHFGQPGWIGRCDLAEPKDLFIDDSDLEVLNAQWLQTEQWRY